MTERRDDDTTKAPAPVDHRTCQSTGRARPRPARPPRQPSAEEEYGQVTSLAILRWWKSYGRDWSATRILVVRGWSEEDLLQEVLMSSVTKSKGRSRWDPDRSNVDAWAGLVGRSRMYHLLKRRRDVQSQAFDSSYMVDGETVRPEESMTHPVDWSEFGAWLKATGQPSPTKASRVGRSTARRTQGGSVCPG